jgi:CMP-N-acetylneuraminic acid synthetase
MDSQMSTEILVTVCARGGSKGLPAKNIRPFFGKPLIAHSIGQAKEWGRGSRIVVSTDSEEIAQAAREAGAEVPFVRPPEMANDTAGKMPVLTHALRECERQFGKKFDCVLDLDPTAPIRTPEDMDRAMELFLKRRPDACFSVVKARKNPYFNMIERSPEGYAVLCKPPAGKVMSRQAAPEVWDMNASIYVFSREFLLREPANLWAGRCDFFEMDASSAFDIDQERDFVVVEALMRWKKGLSRE